MVEWDMNYTLIGEYKIRSDPFSCTAPILASFLIRRPNRLDVPILTEPLDCVRFSVMRREGLLQCRIVHVILDYTMRLLIQAFNLK